MLWETLHPEASYIMLQHDAHIAYFIANLSIVVPPAHDTQHSTA